MKKTKTKPKDYFSKIFKKMMSVDYEDRYFKHMQVYQGQNYRQYTILNLFRITEFKDSFLGTDNMWKIAKQIRHIPYQFPICIYPRKISKTKYDTNYNIILPLCLLDDEDKKNIVQNKFRLEKIYITNLNEIKAHRRKILRNARTLLKGI
jgi:hypothetical protein|tara:strand:- start:571 stop:1020 length:450 start_codon:yes stop_codon:yes gene_type:complete